MVYFWIAINHKTFYEWILNWIFSSKFHRPFERTQQNHATENETGSLIKINKQKPFDLLALIKFHK